MGQGAAQASPQMPWGIWSKILQYSNFLAIHSNFRNDSWFFFKLIFKYFHKILRQLGL